MYWLVSLPLLESEDRTWTILQQKTTFDNDYSVNYKFALPELRVGTLNTLLALSDDLVKVNALMEGVVNKIRRQLFEMQSASNSEEREEVLVEGMTPERFLERFKWDEAKYPPRRPLQETVQAISETITKLDDDLKVKVSEYNQIKSQLSQLMRKQTGTLAVRDLTSIVKQADVVDTENLTTLFVVVPKHIQGEWLSAYETLSDFVVPRSSKQVFEDNDYALFTVVLFRRVVDTFKTAARGKGFQVREYEYNPDEQKSSRDANADMVKGAEAKRAQLEQWSLTSYGEAFSAWIHICAVRLFVESILRYGLPPKFLPVLMKPHAKTTTKLRKTLASTFGTSGTTKYFDEQPDGGGGGMPTEGEMFPYVSFTIQIDG